MSEDELTRLHVITTKKPFYDFEKELRLFVLNYPRSEGGTIPPYDISVGRSVRVDLQGLIQEIYISPFADESYKNEIEALVRKNAISHVYVKESEIRDQ